MSKKQVAGYILDKRIGRGSYATVWKGRVAARPDEAVAVKVISRQTVTETAQLRQEVEVLRRISHDNIVRFRDLKKSAAHFYLVLEFCAGGDLSQFLRERGSVSEDVARGFLTQIAAGLCVLHRENVLHRDLKPQNILLSDGTDSPVLKIADFGFARALHPQDMAATVCGSPLYMAPEILRHEPYDARADLWSVGAILFELLLGRPPFSGANPMQLLANIERHGQLTFDDVVMSEEGQDFLRALLVRRPKERLASHEFMIHPYVRLDPAAARAEAVIVPRTSSDARSRSGAIRPAHSDTAREQGAQLGDADANTVAREPAKGSTSEAAVLNGPMNGDSLVVPGDWCVPSSASPGGVADGVASSSSGDSLPASPVPSPLTCNSPVASPRAVGSVSPPDDATRFFGVTRGAAGNTCGGQAKQGAEDEYVVVATQQPASAFARGSGPTMRAAANSFCGNLSRIAHTLEQLAEREKEQSPSESLALLLRALGLLEKALNVSLAGDDAHESLRRAYARMLAAAEEVAVPVRASSQLRQGEVDALHPPARPNAMVFEYAVQQAREAGVLLSKGHETGGWEPACHEKLSLALLLLDLLSSEADDEDVATITTYTAAIARLITEIEKRLRASDSAAEASIASARVVQTMSPRQLAGC